MLTAPFPYAGGKRKIAELVWRQFGDVDAYVEPFAGSAAVFLARPTHGKAETLNDRSGFITNVWRAIQCAPDDVARMCDWPVNEIDLFARHVALVQQSGTLAEQLMADPRHYDAALAAWWIWGASCWIGSGWCNGDGPWIVEDGKVVKHVGAGVAKRMPRVGAADEYGSTGQAGVYSVKLRGVRAKMPVIGADGGAGAGYRGVHSAKLRGVAKQMPKVGAHNENGSTLQGVHAVTDLSNYFARLAARLRDVRILCGDWQRVLSPRITTAFGTCGVFLDPPYPGTHTAFYEHGQTDVWHAAQQWAIAHGGNLQLRIALCGMDDQTMPDTWHRVAWTRGGGYGSQGDGAGRANASREVVWFSPACGHISDLPLFADSTREVDQ